MKVELDNKKIAAVLNEISFYLKILNEDFKARAYERASDLILNLKEEISDIYFKKGLKGLKEIKGIGDSLALKIEELILKGESDYLKELKNKIPVAVFELNKVEGLGPKKIKILYDKLKIKNLADLKEAVSKGLVKNLPGFGLKLENKILKSLEFLMASEKRYIIAELEDYIENLRDKFLKSGLVENIEMTGSYRRKKETIGDIDILIVSKKPKVVMAYLKKITPVKKVLVQDDSKIIVELENDLEVDLRTASKENFGSALIFCTGSKKHVSKLQNFAIKKGFQLEELGLFKDKKRVAGKTEEEVYRALGLSYIPPELREDNGEIEAAFEKKLPTLINLSDLKGDLQIQSNYSDGLNSLLEIKDAALKNGFEYIAITDHSKNLKVANGLTKERFKKQWQEIDKINEVLKRKKIKFKILKSLECDILKNGDLDFEDEFLKQFDLVGASIHSYFDLPKEEQTKRLKKAMLNKFVHIIFHPTGRLINKRPAYEIDMDEIIKTAALTNTVLEINAFPDRLDLKDEFIKKCISLNVKMAINSDAHSIEHFNYLKYGVFQARRGWAEKKDIINSWPLAKMLKMIKK